MVIVAMVALVLLQRSEGGALGIGGGGGFMASRGQGNILTRSTGILAAAFFATSIVLSVLAQMNAPPSAILDEVPAAAPTPIETDTAPGSGQGILDQLEGMSRPADPPAQGTSGDGAPVPTTPIVPSAPAEPQVPTSQ
jgi:preprotein translocase subunit SecG